MAAPRSNRSVSPLRSPFQRREDTRRPRARRCRALLHREEKFAFLWQPRQGAPARPSWYRGTPVLSCRREMDEPLSSTASGGGATRSPCHQRVDNDLEGLFPTSDG